ncbi:Uncharacterized protein OS=Planctomyces maris DSM 8797 GN=PM8797T_25151 PE=4 SV=1 [Gemmataceae bacterium]|nr:Uncharacterized protein OS=Planctomyces maris DSM 8797 GN=PM8797T_25151 PE=4 SV=1 [Gemmataceae bacterium]VTT98747.1 Uncharacterized protein OS=Planctomyces maris DSM 8797 GN=PM8797T_25151 PE=4 SV=1 [Gemmataceae bacterium]
MSLTDPDPVAPPPRRPLVRWLWTSNPLYVISAGLFLYGLRESFGAQTREVDTWALMGGLAGYTLLLAAAAFVLVKVAGAWDDVRTVLLLVVLMFLATSVTFDELLVFEPRRGMLFNLGGLAFAVLLSEGVLHGLGLRLPVLYRVPYHLALALFFLYPIALAELRTGDAETVLWALWGFGPAAAVVTLTLLPAARRGSAYLRGTGSPWPWPFYPWSLFVFLAAAVCGRSFLLCWSLHTPQAASDLAFGPHFLVPFGFAVAAVVLEIGIAAWSRRTQLLALAVPVGTVALAGLGHQPDEVYREFLGHFAARLGGTPLFVSLVAATGFYLIAAVRRVPLAFDGFVLAVAATAIVGPHSLWLNDATGVRVAPLAAAVSVAVTVALVRRDGWRLLLAGSVAAAWLGHLGWWGYRVLREQVAGLDYLTAGLVLLPAAVLVSLGKSGALARWARVWLRRVFPGRIDPVLHVARGNE